MEGTANNKLKLLYIIDILREHSDEEHPIGASEICTQLASRGIRAERKAIYNDIDNLIFYGYDIIYSRGKKSGYFLASRELELPEIYLLTDAVQAAGFISAKKTRELVSKLEGMMSKSQARARAKSIYIDYGHKCRNEEIYLSIDTLRRSIDNGKKVSLLYCNRNIDENRRIVTTEKPLTVSPYALVWMDDHYYLVCNNEKYDNLMHLRLDRMKRVTETEEKYRHFSEVCEYTDRFDVADYSAKTFNMFGGELTDIELSCRSHLIDQIIDRFGEDIHITSSDGDRFTFRVKGLASLGLAGWIMQFGGDVEVLSPAALRNMISEKIALLQKSYEKDEKNT